MGKSCCTPSPLTRCFLLHHLALFRVCKVWVVLNAVLMTINAVFMRVVSIGLQEQKRASRAFEKLAGKIEPGMMAKHFMRPEDNTIRVTDIPEREQAYRGPDPSNMDYKAMSA